MKRNLLPTRPKPLMALALSLLLGAGPGSSPFPVQAASGCATPGFAAPTNFFFGPEDGPESVAVGDFNGDSQPDLAVASSNSSFVSILLGDGAGDFSGPTNFDAGTNPDSVALGDFNGDGKLDLAVANFNSNNVSILLGDGAGDFTGPTHFGAGTSPRSVAVGDFNGDGKPDLAVANESSDNVSILLGDGTGSFTGPTNLGAGASPFSVAVGDFNGDSKPDLAVANFLSASVSLLLGDGAGGFSGPTHFGAGTNPRSVAVGDFNGDSKPDLAVANVNSSNVSILLGNGAGGFGGPTNFGAGAGPFSLVVGDFNGDSQPDLAVANQSSDNVSILLGDGAGSFSGQTNFGAGDGPTSVGVGDFNGDSQPDLAVANINSGTVSLLLNHCNTPPAAQCKDVTVSAGASCTASASVDDGSSDPDSSDTITLKQSPTGPYALGSTAVTLTITDNHEASSSCSAAVTVVDNTLPTITAPPAVTVNAGTTSCGVVISDATLGGATVEDNCSVSVSRSGVPAGNLFPVGTTPLTYTVTDEAGNTASATQPVTVVDTTPPTLTLKPSLSLWPPDHTYRTLTTAQMVQSASDSCNSSLGASSVVIEKVTSDEPDNASGDGDGNTVKDILIAPGCKAVQLRAERDQTKNGRVYSVTLRVRDAAGNTTRRDFQVRVPINQSGPAAVQEAPAFMVSSSCP